MVAELNKIKYLLLIELFLLTLFTAFDYIPFVISFSIILLIVSLLLAFKYPVIAIHILVFSILIDSFVPLNNSSSGPSLLVVEFFFIILLCLLIVKFLFEFNFKTDIPIFILIWLPFLIWALVTGLLVGVDKLRILTYWKNYFAGFFALSLAYYAIRNHIHVKSVIIGIIIWGVMLSFLEIKILIDMGGFSTGIVGLFLKKNLLTLGWGRSNYLAAFFVVIIPFTIGYLFYTKSAKLRYLLVFALVIMSFAIILTLSRGGILALFISLVILFSRVLKRRTIIPILIIFSIVAIVLLLNPLTYVLIERIYTFEASASVYSRINFYEDVWRAFLNHPITGVGLGNLSYYATFILAPNASPSAHNILLGALGEIGLVGTLFYLVLLGYFLVKTFYNYKLEKYEPLKVFKWCYFSALLGGLIHTLVEPTLEGLQFSIVFWTLAGTYTRLDLLKTS